MMTVQTIYLLAPLAVILLSARCDAHPMIRQRSDDLRTDVREPICKGCGDDCDKCQFGITISSYCKVPECLKGPGGGCGGPSDTFGTCAEGLRCACNKCVGCSLQSLTCFMNHCLPHQSMESRHLRMFERYAPVAK